jgi:actin-like ATPase involved in cell morphogenesis
MEMEQMVECLLAEIRINDTSHEEMKAETGSLASQRDVNQEKMEACHKQMKAHQENMEAAIHFIQSKLEETIKLRVEDVQACVDHRTQGPLQGT